MRSPAFLCVLMVLASGGVVTAGDWPQLLGPGRNGVAVGERISTRWPAGGPRVVWKQRVGSGFAGPAVAGERLVVFHRVGEEDRVECLDARTGERIWSHAYPSRYTDDFGFDPGPRAVPTIDGDRVYTHGAQGMVLCLGMADGQVRWSVDTARELGSRKGFFGRAGSPLIEGDKLLLNVGGPSGAGLAAFDKLTGKLAWKTSSHEAGYSSPTAATIHGRRYALFFTREGLVATNPADGAVRFEHHWRSGMDASVNAATPIVVDDMIFLSASYGTGATVLKIDHAGRPTTLWAGDDILSNHYATSVAHGGHVYGFDGRQESGPRLRCVEMATGVVKWTHEPMAAGTLMVVDGKLLVLTERGELMAAEATAAGFKPLSRSQVLGFDARAYPAFADGYFYGRDKRHLVCLDLRAAP